MKKLEIIMIYIILELAGLSKRQKARPATKGVKAFTVSYTGMTLDQINVLTKHNQK